MRWQPLGRSRLVVSSNASRTSSMQLPPLSPERNPGGQGRRKDTFRCRRWNPPSNPGGLFFQINNCNDLFSVNSSYVSLVMSMTLQAMSSTFFQQYPLLFGLLPCIVNFKFAFCCDITPALADKWLACGSSS